MLPTFLEQKSWDTVKDDVENVIKKNGWVEKRGINNGGFTDDI